MRNIGHVPRLLGMNPSILQLRCLAFAVFIAGGTASGYSPYLGPYPAAIAGNHVLAPNGTGSVVMYDLAGRVAGRFRFDKQPSKIVVSPDGSHVAIAGQNGPVSLFDLQSQECIWSQYPASSGIISVSDLAFAHDGKSLIVACFGPRAIVFDPATGKRLHTLTAVNDDSLVYAALSPDGSRAAMVGLLGRVEVRDVISGRCIGQFLGASTIRYSSDGSFLATLSDHDGSELHLRIIPADLLGEGKDLGAREPIGRIEPAPDGRFLVTTEPTQGRTKGFVCDPKSGQMTLSWEVSDSYIQRLADFDPLRKIAVSTDNDYVTHIVDFRENSIIEIPPLDPQAIANARAAGSGRYKISSLEVFESISVVLTIFTIFVATLMRSNARKIAPADNRD